MPSQIIDIPTRTILRLLAVFLGVVALYLILDLVVLLLLSIVLASGIAPIVSWFERRGVPRLLGLLTVVIVGLATVSLLLFFVIPPFLKDLTEFAESFPVYTQLLLKELRPIGIAPDSAIGQGLTQVLHELTIYLGRGVASLPALALQLFGGVVATASVLLVTFYLALERDGVEKFLRLFAPKTEESYVIDLWRRAQKQIGAWAQGQLLLMALIGVVSYVGLSFLGVEYALLLAILAALFEIVPIVGPIVAGGAAVAVSIFQSAELALFVLLFYTAVQQLEGHVIVPLLYRRILRLHPVIVIFALLVGARLAGVIGILLAVPLAAVFTEFLQDYSKGKVRL